MSESKSQSKARCTINGCDLSSGIPCRDTQKNVQFRIHVGIKWGSCLQDIFGGQTWFYHSVNLSVNTGILVNIRCANIPDFVGLVLVCWRTSRVAIS